MNTVTNLVTIKIPERYPVTHGTGCLFGSEKQKAARRLAEVYAMADGKRQETGNGIKS